MSPGTTLTASEIASQPDCWRQAERLAPSLEEVLPGPGERVAVIGCGTSWFVAQSYAALRERAGQGLTDAFAASQFPYGRVRAGGPDSNRGGTRHGTLRVYDRVLALTRSGTTTEVLEVLDTLRGEVPLSAITADPGTPVMEAADQVAVLDFADERSVVQTRFATSALALLRAHLGHRLEPVARDAERALAARLPAEVVRAEQFTFLGTDWTYGLALEAALKMREAAGAWTEAYPAMEHRHGPISIAAPNRVVWALGRLPEGLADSVRQTGAVLLHDSCPASAPVGELDPMADLVRAQRVAVAVAEARGMDPDRPRNLTRSVVLN
ncbi:sugar isomerase [Streptomyces sp. NPDC005438]|uniref:SIS domain-containing protein n=1 Tax=Streptomyces sp. NPDC005438 TaxID=3156880 RepID=UPI0033A280E6